MAETLQLHEEERALLRSALEAQIGASVHMPDREAMAKRLHMWLGRADAVTLMSYTTLGGDD